MPHATTDMSLSIGLCPVLHLLSKSEAVEYTDSP
jgi:hypothetical protein